LNKNQSKILDFQKQSFIFNEKQKLSLNFTIKFQLYRCFNMSKLVTFVFLFPLLCFGQYQLGTTNFQFLNASSSARNAGAGNGLISVYDNDLGLALDNPALLNEQMDGQVHYSYGKYPAGIHFGNVNYVLHSKIGTFAPSIRYFSYGQFVETDEIGNDLGTFSGGEYAVGTSYARKINDVVSIGASLSIIGSQLYRYNSFGIAGSFSGLLVHPNKLLCATFLVKNAGIILKDYTSSSQSKLPLDVQAGLSYKLKHAPFRFGFQAHQLNQLQNYYTDPFAQATYDPLTGDTIPVFSPSIGKKIANHFNFQMELIASKSFQLRGGFNFMRREQMKVTEHPGLAGFSMGMSLKLKKFNLDYGVQFYSKAGSIHSIGLSSSIQNWKKH
jgi:hypothetical protein